MTEPKTYSLDIRHLLSDVEEYLKSADEALQDVEAHFGYALRDFRKAGMDTRGLLENFDSAFDAISKEIEGLSDRLGEHDVDSDGAEVVFAYGTEDGHWVQAVVILATEDVQCKTPEQLTKLCKDFLLQLAEQHSLGPAAFITYRDVVFQEEEAAEEEEEMDVPDAA